MVPGECAVFAFPAGEGEFRPDTDHVGVFDLLCAVLGRIRYGDNILTFIGAHSVVEDDIREDPDPVVVEGPDCLEIFLFGAVFGADSVLLVEFAQVIHVVDAVADVFLGCPLICRRKPYIRDADSVQALCLGGAAFPPQPVVRQIPFKILHHSSVH